MKFDFRKKKMIVECAQCFCCSKIDKVVKDICHSSICLEITAKLDEHTSILMMSAVSCILLVHVYDSVLLTNFRLHFNSSNVTHITHHLNLIGKLPLRFQRTKEKGSILQH